MCPQHIWDIGLAVPPIPLTFLIMMSFISGIPCKKICQDHPVVHLWKHWLRYQKRKAGYRFPFSAFTVPYYGFNKFCSNLMDLHVFFFCLFFCCFFFDHYIVYFFAGRHNYTFYIFKSLSKMEILPVWALSSIWHEFYELPMLFQCSTCLSQRQKRENILLEKKWMRKFIYPIVYSTNST